ncbi:MAG: hypothetical protein MJZ30_06185 [Paludibacteraceae bacterium]|nr:hypothetical protein [Paludibacteraceae bacterium]
MYTRNLESLEEKDPDHPQFAPSEAEGADEKADAGEITVLYEGSCVKYGSQQMRRFALNGVIKADHCVDIPELVNGIHPGMRIDVRDAQGEWHDIEIVVAYADSVWGMGTTVFFNIAFN